MQRKDTSRVIGSISLHKDNYRQDGLPVRMLRYGLNEKEWGRGYMQVGYRAILAYGFEKVGLALISAFHLPFNDHSRRTIDERLGFQKEGKRYMANTLYDGTMVDEAAYSMTRQEFEQLYCK